jgi:hypothetical protein
MMTYLNKFKNLWLNHPVLVFPLLLTFIYGFLKITDYFHLTYSQWTYKRGVIIPIYTNVFPIWETVALGLAVIVFLGLPLIWKGN